MIIGELDKEWSDYLAEVHVASSQIHQLAAAALDPATPAAAYDL